MASPKFLPFLPILLLLLSSAVASSGDGAGTSTITGSRDITKILEQSPNFSTLKDLLTQTKLADEINSRQSITVFAVPNSAMSSVTSLPADVQKKVLSVHVILDYFDMDRISNLQNSTQLLTTLFQASGQATGQTGFVNATDAGDGIVKLGSAVPNAELNSEVVQLVAKQPYNISILEISQPIIPPGIASSGNGNGNGNNGSSSATPSPAPKAATPTPAPKAAPPTATSAPKAAATPAPSASKAGPPASSPKAAATPAPSASKTGSPASSPNDTAPAPAKAAPVPESAPAAAPEVAPATAPAAESPADSTAPTSDSPGPGPAGAADKSSAVGKSVVGLGVGVAMWAAAFLGAL